MGGAGRRRSVVVTVLAAGVLLAGCTSSPAGPTGDRVTSTASDVPFAGCDAVACSGSIDGASYQILLPGKWNGTLLLYSHGYRTAQPVPPSFTPVSTEPDPAPGWSDGQEGIGKALLAEGYALAGSAYASNGWAVDDGVAAGEGLYAFFRDNVGVPDRVYAWGESLGGLVTAELAERHPDWVAGSAPLCGVLAGLNPNMDLALDVAYAVKQLVWPGLKLVGYTSYEDAVRSFQQAAERIAADASDVAGRGAATLLFIAALVDAPPRTQTFDGATAQSRVKAATEGILTALGFGTFGRYDIEQRVGGNPSQNTTTDYAKRIDAADQRRVDAVSPGATTRLAARLAAGKRVAADPAARERAAQLGDPQGSLTHPMVTLHTAYDPLVIAANESWYAARVAAAGRTADLHELVTVPPATYPEKPGAPYGAGHCSFTAASQVGVIAVLDSWVRDGRPPDEASVETALGKDSGYDPQATAPPWPAGTPSR